MFLFTHVSLPALVSELNYRCFLRSRRSTEMWCPDDIGGIVEATCRGESMVRLPRVRWILLACKNGASPDCFIVGVVVVVVVVVFVLVAIVVLDADINKKQCVWSHDYVI